MYVWKVFGIKFLNCVEIAEEYCDFSSLSMFSYVFLLHLSKRWAFLLNLFKVKEFQRIRK